MSQTTYNTKFPLAFAGLEADIRPSVKVTKKNAETVDIPYGIAVIRGATDNAALEPDAVTSDILGISLHSHWEDNQDLSGDDGIPTGNVFTVQQSGAMYVQVTEAVTDGADVYIRIADSIADPTITQKGSFGASSDTNTAIKYHGAKYQTTTAADGFAIVTHDANLHGSNELMTYDYDHVQVAEDTTVKLFKNDASRHFVVTYAGYINLTGLVEDASNEFDIILQHGSTGFANWSTKTGDEGTIAANTFVDMTLAAAANLIIPPSAEISLLLDETGTATLPAGRVFFQGYYV